MQGSPQNLVYRERTRNILGRVGNGLGPEPEGVVASHPGKSIRPTMQGCNVLDTLCSPLCNNCQISFPLTSS